MVGGGVLCACVLWLVDERRSLGRWRCLVGPEELLRRFKFHPATEVTGPLHDEARLLLHDAARQVVSLTPVGREQSLAVTALEEAMFWTNAAIARAPR